MQQPSYFFGNQIDILAGNMRFQNLITIHDVILQTFPREIEKQAEDVKATKDPELRRVKLDKLIKKVSEYSGLVMFILNLWDRISRGF
jgi:hypothetical protein